MGDVRNYPWAPVLIMSHHWLAAIEQRPMEADLMVRPNIQRNMCSQIRGVWNYAKPKQGHADVQCSPIVLILFSIIGTFFKMTTLLFTTVFRSQIHGRKFRRNLVCAQACRCDIFLKSPTISHIYCAASAVILFIAISWLACLLSVQSRTHAVKMDTRASSHKGNLT